MSIEAGVAKRSSVFRGLLNRFGGVVARWNELQRLDSQEMEAIARELNLSKAELCALTFRPSGSLQSLSRRLCHAGLFEDELAAAHGDVLRDMRRVCGQCQSKARCARDLKHERRATPAKYCPNEQTLRALADEMHQAAARILPLPAARN
ncbi:DUF6455 family protein [Bradyrhizobium sp.]|uniref:DUF6455 family protein n=1 Tax=Bradyrhizobium sp. TaxID=376 RepID=UPI00261B37E4|nr:DUF6455 family protein [Bradyrhizobium sp.]